MLSRENRTKQQQIQMCCIEDLVPQDHLLRKIESAIDFTFIYPLVEDKYSTGHGRPSLDPVLLIKMAMVQYMFGIRSMRQTVKEIEVNMAYRWFIGLDMFDAVPHFTTFGKNYSRRFEGTDLFEQIFTHILEECIKHGFVKDDVLYVDSTHIKASANKNKKVRIEATRQAKSYHKELQAEINRDRQAHGKKPFDDEDGDNTDSGEKVTVTQSTTDPDSGMFVKGEHERSFAYMVPTACDKHGFVLGYDVCSGNVHDSVSFDKLYEVIKPHDPCMLVMDSAYKTPAILRKLLKDGVYPVTPRTNPKTGKGYFRKYEYVYDELNDAYICPNNKFLHYSTTNREGYREYKSNSCQCAKCGFLDQCTRSRDHVKTVTRHVWQDYIELSDDIRYTIGIHEVYKKRKETIERVFADAKDKHGMRYTQYRGSAKLKMEVGLTFACMNLKKLALWLHRFPSSLRASFVVFRFYLVFMVKGPLRTTFTA